MEADAPDDTQRQSQLWGLHIKLGDALKALSQRDGALQRYEQAVGIAQTTAAAEPERAETLADLATSLERLGQLLNEMGHSQRAYQALDQALPIRQQRAEAEPEQATHQADLASLTDQLGELARSLGHGPLARALLAQSLKSSQQLVSASPEQPDLARMLSSTLGSFGSLLDEWFPNEVAVSFLHNPCNMPKAWWRPSPTAATFSSTSF
jgi:tetratricopeptide (TPR) repeat protein